PLRYWDTSALVPLVVRQRASGRMRSLYRSDAGVLAWWGTRVESESAISRLEREGQFQRRAATAARPRADRFCATWQEVPPSHPIRDHAGRLLRLPALCAVDALPLLAA